MLESIPIESLIKSAIGKKLSEFKFVKINLTSIFWNFLVEAEASIGATGAWREGDKWHGLVLFLLNFFRNIDTGLPFLPNLSRNEGCKE